MEDFWRDVRFGLRNLRSNSGFALVAIFALTLGIGATSSIFSVVSAVLLDSFPYEEPERLVVLAGTIRRGANIDRVPISFLDFTDWRKQNEVFTDLVARSNPRSFNVLIEGTTEHVQGEFVSSGYFRLLGMRPVLGRGFSSQEDAVPPRARVAVVSHSLWQQRFGGDPDVIGRSIALNGESYEIVGVAPSGFLGLTDSANVWLPMTTAFRVLGSRYIERRGFRWISVVGRLAEGRTIEQAQDAMDAITLALAEEHPTSNESFGIRVLSLREEWLGDLRAPLLILLGAAGFVLLIACTNVASLLLARAATRRQEVSLRSALGASRGRLIRQFLTESLLLALLGSLFGLLLAYWCTGLLVAASAVDFRSFIDIGIDPLVIGVTLAVSLLAGVGFGLAGAFSTSQVDLGTALRGASRESAGPARHRLLSTLAISQVALTLILFIATGFMVNGFRQLRATDLGFRPENVLTARVDLKGERYADDVSAWALARQLLERLGSLPGVRSVALAGPGIPTDTWYGNFGYLEEAPAPQSEDRLILLTHFVSPGYFSVLGIPLIEGRVFGARDSASAPGAIIISRSMADRFWPGESAVGKRLKLSRSSEDWLTTVGVVGDVDHSGLAGEPRPGYEVYLPLFQRPPRTPPTLNVLVLARISGDLVPLLRSEIATIAPHLPPYDVATMEQRLDRQMAENRFGIILVSLFAGLALVLAAVGIYGLISYSVNQRNREIGIRMALGARPGDILRMVIRQGTALALIGIVLGLATGLLVVPRLLASLLYEIDPDDPQVLVLASLLLLIVGLAASCLPAIKATRIAPAMTMRSE